ncbi:MAG: choice-of-anchor L domain-containing protein [Armatimonadota bacterium]|nr:choice-of-anchor L domain-containing protein [Armatimonadota bacterium]MDR7528911.1 choice-of-anchor L domain-containing protein [Armatimonadota bacterium]
MRPHSTRPILVLVAAGGLLFSAAEPVEAGPRRVPASPSALTRAAGTRVIGPATAQALAQAMDIPLETLVSADLGGSDPAGVGVSNRPVGRFFPRRGASFAILSTGRAADAELPNDSGSNSTVLSGLNHNAGQDMVQLRLVLRPPAGATCLAFDFAYYSEEFPEFVGSLFNDVFLAELGGSDFTIDPSSGTVTAPLNFAFDPEGNLVSVNTVLGVTAGNASGTTYDGGTPLLRATAQLPAGAATVEVVLTIMDLGDSSYDSTVFVDNFEWLSGAGCTGGRLVEVQGTVVVGLVSVGLGILPDGASVNPAVSGDARFVAFESRARNLAAQICGDTSGAGRAHVYRRDLASLEVRCLSRTNLPADADATEPDISRDGSRVVFQSRASNLVSGCADGRQHVFLADVAAGTLTCLTAGATGDSAHPRVSADGAQVVFETRATNLVAGCTAASSVVRVTPASGARTCVSLNGNGPSARPAVGEDGGVVVFETGATNLADCGGASRVVVVHWRNGFLTCMTPGANGDSGQADVSDDGATVAFASRATTLDPACANPFQQIYVWQAPAGPARCFSRGFDGQPGNGDSGDPRLSGDGRALAFATLATNLIPAGAPRAAPSPLGGRAVVAQGEVSSQVVMRSTAATDSILQLISAATAGGAGNGASGRPAMDDTGTVVVFQSQASNLVSGDTNGESDIFSGSILPPPPIGRPRIVTPATGSVFPLFEPTVITFRWTDVGAAQYGFEFSAPDRQFTNPNGTGPDGINGFGGGGGGFLCPSPGLCTATTLTVTLAPGTIPNGTYNVRVIALGMPGATFSDAVAVTLGPVPPSAPKVPSITSPASGTLVVPLGSVVFAWTAVAGAPGYRFAFTGPVSGFFDLAVTSFLAEIPAGIPPGTYEITVQALDGAGVPLGPPSDPILLVVVGV